jgi:tetratricopeptide (TPR) repeat protein
MKYFANVTSTDQADYNEALTHFYNKKPDRALELFKRLRSSELVTLAKQGMAFCYLEKRDPDNALFNFFNLQKYSWAQLRAEQRDECIIGIARTYKQLKNYEMALIKLSDVSTPSTESQLENIDILYERNRAAMLPLVKSTVTPPTSASVESINRNHNKNVETALASVQNILSREANHPYALALRDKFMLAMNNSSIPKSTLPSSPQVAIPKTIFRPRYDPVLLKRLIDAFKEEADIAAADPKYLALLYKPKSIASTADILQLAERHQAKMRVLRQDHERAVAELTSRYEEQISIEQASYQQALRARNVTKPVATLDNLISSQPQRNKLRPSLPRIPEHPPALRTRSSQQQLFSQYTILPRPRSAASPTFPQVTNTSQDVRNSSSASWRRGK